MDANEVAFVGRLCNAFPAVGRLRSEHRLLVPWNDFPVDDDPGVARDELGQGLVLAGDCTTSSR